MTDTNRHSTNAVDQEWRQAAESAMYGEIDPHAAEAQAAQDEQDAEETNGIAVTIARFSTAFPTGPAYGTVEHTTWSAFASLCTQRRVGPKDGGNFIPATFRPEPDGRVRRLKENVLARSAVALDIETSKSTGEVPPPFTKAVASLRREGWAGAVYTSHSHTEAEPRYRIVLPLSEPIGADLPAAEIVADALWLRGVLDESKLGAASLFYLPSCQAGERDRHKAEIVGGNPIDAAWLTEEAGALLAEREAARQKERAEAMEAAARRRDARAAAGFGTCSSVIDAIRKRLDLDAELISHGYKPAGQGRYLYPGSKTGVAGVYTMTGRDGVDRVFSHHAGDPLAAGNLPSWCAVKAVDAVDTKIILDHSGDRKAGLSAMAKRFGIESEKRVNGQPANIDFTNLRVNGRPVCGNADADAGAGQAREEPNTGDEQYKDEAYWTEQGWPDPLDFLADAELTGAPELLPEHVPEAIGKFAFDVAGRLGCDSAAMALCQLVSVSSVISDDWKIQPKQHDDSYLQCARVWGLILGPPSTMKTPLIAIATAPVDKLETVAHERHTEAMLSYKIQHKKWKEAGADPASEPRKPRRDRYLVENTTVEAISEILREDDAATMRAPARKLLIRQDELSEWLATMDQYKGGGNGGADRGAYLRMFNGGRFSVDRIGRGSFPISSWSGCILGGIQPEPIQKIASKAADDGLLQRFLYIVPSSNRRGEDRQPDADAAKRYADLFSTLSAMRPARGTNGLTDGRVVLSAEAHERRREMEDVVEALAAMPDISNRLKSAFEKWAGIWARITLAFHLIECADAKKMGAERLVDVVDNRVATMSTKFMRDVLLPHLLRAEATMFATEQTGHARWIAGFILSRAEDLKARDRVAARDIMRAYRAMKAPEQKKQVLDIMDTLEKMGWLLRIEKNRQPTDVAVVNPKVFIRFGEQAKREKENRDATKKRIQETLRKHKVSPFGNSYR